VKEEEVYKDVRLRPILISATISYIVIGGIDDELRSNFSNGAANVHRVRKIQLTVAESNHFS